MEFVHLILRESKYVFQGKSIVCVSEKELKFCSYSHVGRAYVQVTQYSGIFFLWVQKLCYCHLRSLWFLSATEICCMSPLFSKAFSFFFCTRPEMHQFGRKNEKGKKDPLHLFPIIHFFESRMFLGKTHQNTVLSALCVGSFNQLLWLSSLSLFQRLGLVLLKYFGFLIYLMFLFMNQH